MLERTIIPVIISTMTRRGMTLLELLLALAVFVVLMTIVWSTMTYLFRLELRRGQQSEQQRIIRTWTQMMNDDFRSAIQDTEQLNKAEGSETIRHFGVSGTATLLRIDISDYSWRAEQSSELRTIFYEFHRADGLVRLERDYATSTSVEGLKQMVPEIVSGQFRYFDGKTWYNQWASLDREGAPTAIEVTFNSLSTAESQRWRRQGVNSREPVMNRIIVQIPAASQTFSEEYRRATPPPKPQDIATVPPPPSFPSPPPPEAQSPTPSPFHSLFGDD
jgi:prepilin-type N-terminal cleavage/methylation domain-containing protein